MRTDTPQCWPLRMELSSSLRLLPLSPLQLQRHLKTFLFAGTSKHWRRLRALLTWIIFFDYITLFWAFTFSLTCGFKTVHFITLKNLTCVDAAKIMPSQVLAITYNFTHIVIYLANPGGPLEISQRAACGPRALECRLDSTDVIGLSCGCVSWDLPLFLLLSEVNEIWLDFSMVLGETLKSFQVLFNIHKLFLVFCGAHCNHQLSLQSYSCHKTFPELKQWHLRNTTKYINLVKHSNYPSVH